MANRRKIWVYSPRKPPKPGVPEAIKQALDAKARLYPLGLGVRPAGGAWRPVPGEAAHGL